MTKEKLLDISEEIVEDIGDIMLDITKSLDFKTVMRKNNISFKCSKNFSIRLQLLLHQSYLYENELLI